MPLTGLDLQTAGYLIVLMVGMQAINDLGMLGIFRLRGRNPAELLTLFTTAVEMGSVLIAVLVALVFSSHDAGVIGLLLIVRTLGMLILKRYAEMRSRLETLVDERTENFCVAMADIDHIKRINDRVTHSIGDEVLVRVAEILRSRCRQTDVVARYGGEEFLLCFPDTSSTFAEQICGQRYNAKLLTYSLL